MGFLGVIWEGIKTVGSFIVEGVKDFIPKVGPFLSGVAEKIGVVFDKLKVGIEKAATILGNIITNFVSPILNVFGIKTPDNPDELGMKAEASDKSLEDFGGDTEAYIKYLQEEIKIDKERLNNLTPQEKIRYRTVSLGIEAKAAGDKLGVNLPAEGIPVLQKISEGTNIVFTGEQLVSIIKNLKESNTDLTDVIKYLEGSNSVSAIKVGDAVEKALSSANVDNVGKTIIEMKKAQNNEIKD